MSPISNDSSLDSPIVKLASALDLPFEGELFRAREKKFNETIVFVHHFGGNKRSLLRHIKLVNEFGFDAVAFSLLFAHKMPFRMLPISADLKFGIRYIWTEQVESILNSLPGRKIIYSFSMPSNSAVEAISRRQAEDINALVCDGGPFLELIRCTWNLYEVEYGIDNIWLRGLYTGLSLFAIGLGLPLALSGIFAKFPRGFPILSIRGGHDPLVPMSAIDEFFSHAQGCEIEKVVFEEAGHLDSIKKQAKDYAQTVRTFLIQHATRL